MGQIERSSVEVSLPKQSCKIQSLNSKDEDVGACSGETNAGSETEIESAEREIAERELHIGSDDDAEIDE